MGPRPKARKNEYSRACAAETLTASMGPRPKARKNVPSELSDCVELTAASMGPRPKARKNLQPVTLLTKAHRKRFNGAAPEGAEERGTPSCGLSIDPASMGPRPKGKNASYRRLVAQ